MDDVSQQGKNMLNEKLLDKIKELLLQTVAGLPDNKVLPYDIAVNKIYFYFINTFGKYDFDNAKRHIDQALKQLVEKEYLNVRKDCIGRYASCLVTKGLNFDKVVSKIDEDNTPNTSMNNFSAENIQAGNYNTQNLDYTSSDFLEALRNFDQKNIDERESMISEISNLVKTGASIEEAIAKFISIFG